MPPDNSLSEKLPDIDGGSIIDLTILVDPEWGDVSIPTGAYVDVINFKLNPKEYDFSLKDLKNGLSRVYESINYSEGKPSVSVLRKSEIQFWDISDVDSVDSDRKEVNFFDKSEIIDEIKTNIHSNTYKGCKIDPSTMTKRMCFVGGVKLVSSYNDEKIEELRKKGMFSSLIVSAADIFENWLVTDGITVKQLMSLAMTSVKGNLTRTISLTLLLLPLTNMPPPTITATLVSVKKVVDNVMLRRPYMQYNVVIRQCRLEWCITRRFSEFVKLDQQLQADPSIVASGMSLPVFPNKYINNKYMSCTENVIQYRKKELQLYLDGILDLNKKNPNPFVLSFLGLLTNSVQETKESSGEKLLSKRFSFGKVIPSLRKKSFNLDTMDNKKNSSVVHISKLQGMVRWGDIVLFRCINSISSLQRKITGGDWDHVGIIVSRAGTNYNNFNISELYLMECTAQGVTIYPLIARLSAYHKAKFCQAIALRCFYGTRSQEMFDKMISFVTSVDGTPYGFKLLTNLFPSAKVAEKDLQSKSPPTQKEVNSPEKSSNEATESGNMFTRLCTRINNLFCRRVDDEQVVDTSTHNDSMVSELVQGNGKLPSSVSNEKNPMFSNVDASAGSKSPTVVDVNDGYSCTNMMSCVPNIDMDGVPTGASTTGSTAATYFCSELIAACLIAMGIIHSQHNPAFFWPDSFAQGKYIDACCSAYSDRNSILSLEGDVVDEEDNGESDEDEADKNARINNAGDASDTYIGGSIGYYGDEMLIDCRVIEIAKAVVIPVKKGRAEDAKASPAALVESTISAKRKSKNLVKDVKSKPEQAEPAIRSEEESFPMAQSPSIRSPLMVGELSTVPCAENQENARGDDINCSRNNSSRSAGADVDLKHNDMDDSLFAPVATFVPTLI